MSVLAAREDVQRAQEAGQATVARSAVDAVAGSATVKLIKATQAMARTEQAEASQARLIANQVSTTGTVPGSGGTDPETSRLRPYNRAIAENAQRVASRETDNAATAQRLAQQIAVNPERQVDTERPAVIAQIETVASQQLVEHQIADARRITEERAAAQPMSQRSRVKPQR